MGRPNRWRTQEAGGEARRRFNPALQQELVGACKLCDAKRIRAILQTGRHAVDVNLIDQDGYPPIVYCVVGDSVACIKELSSIPDIDLCAPDELGDTTLHHGIIHGAAAAVKHLLSLGVSPNVPNASVNTPLHTAILNNKAEFVAMLIRERSLNVDAKNDKFLTPLAMAVSDNQPMLCRLLTRAGANPIEPCGREHFTPVHLACAMGYEQALAQITEKWSAREFNRARDARGRTPLHVAVLEGRRKIVQSLLAGGANPFIQDAQGFDALHYAVQGDRPETLKLLLASSAGDSAAETTTIMHTAAAGGQTGTVRYLLAQGISPTRANDNGETPLHAAVASGDRPTVDLLLDPCKAVIDETNNDGNTALHTAIAKGFSPLALMLLNAGANAEIADGSGATPASLAVQHRCKEVLEAVAEQAPSSLAIADTSQRRPLHYACQHPDLVSAVERLVELDADGVDAEDEDGMTPLLIACAAGNGAAVDCLLSTNASTTHTNKRGETALHLAAAGGYSQLAFTLIVRGAPINAMSTARRTALDIAYSARAGPCAERILQNGGHTGQLLVQRAVLICQTAWRTCNALKRRAIVTETPPEDARVMLLFTLRCQLSVIRRYFRRQAWQHHNSIVRRWVGCSVLSVDPNTPHNRHEQHQPRQQRQRQRQQHLQHHSSQGEQHSGSLSTSSACASDVSPTSPAATAWSPPSTRYSSSPSSRSPSHHHARSQHHHNPRNHHHQRHQRHKYADRRSRARACKSEQGARTLPPINQHRRAARNALHASMNMPLNASLNTSRNSRKHSSRRDSRDHRPPPHSNATTTSGGRIPASINLTTTGTAPAWTLSTASTAVSGHAEEEEHMLANLRNKLAEQTRALKQLQRENTLLKTISKTQEKVLMKVHGVDTRLQQQDKQEPTKAVETFGPPSKDLKPPSTKLDLELQRQQRLIRNFKQRFDTLQATLSKSEEAAAPLPPKVGPDTDPDAYAQRAQQKVLRKQMQDALQEIVKLRSDTESLSKLLQRSARDDAGQSGSLLSTRQ